MTKSKLTKQIEAERLKIQMEKNGSLSAQREDKKPRYRIQFDFTYNGAPGKELDQKQETQPDMSLTVRQLLINHTRGIDSKAQIQEPFYFDMQVPTITDLTDVKLFADQLEEKLSQTRQFIKDDLDKGIKDRNTDKLKKAAQKVKDDKAKILATKERLKNHTETIIPPEEPNH